MEPGGVGRAFSGVASGRGPSGFLTIGTPDDGGNLLFGRGGRSGTGPMSWNTAFGEYEVSADWGLLVANGAVFSTALRRVERPDASFSIFGFLALNGTGFRGIMLLTLSPLDRGDVASSGRRR